MKSKLYYFTGLFLTGLSFPIMILYVILMTVGNLFLSNDSDIAGMISNPVFLVFVCLSIFIAPVILFIKYKKINQLEKIEFLTIDCMRWIIALLMFFYGFNKIHNNFFDYTYRTMDSRVMDVHSFDLTWYYFGKSNLQVFLIGLLELIPAILILFRRTYFIGVLILLPIAANVLWTNLFNHISGLTFIVSILIMMLCTFIVYARKKEIVNFLQQLSDKKLNYNFIEKNINSFLKYLTIISIICFTSIIIISSFKNTTSGIHKKIGAYELIRLKINRQEIIPKSGDPYYKTIYFESQSRWDAIVDYSEEYKPKWIIITWSANNDSVVTYLKRQNAVENDEVNPDTKFIGTYKFTDSLLFINGIQKLDTINSIYKRKKIEKNKWFW